MKNRNIKVKMLRDNRGSITPVKVQSIHGAAKISIPVKGDADDKVLRAGDRITDQEADFVCQCYEADVHATL